MRASSGAAEAERAVPARGYTPLALFSYSAVRPRRVPGFSHRVSGLINKCEFCKRVCRPSSTLGNTNDKVHPGARGTKTGSDDAPFSRWRCAARSRDRANTTKPESIQSLPSPVQHAAAGTALRRGSVGVRASMAPGVPRLRSQRLGPAARGTAGKHQGCSVSVANNKTILTWAA